MSENRSGTDLEVVLHTTDPGLLPLAKSLLEAAGIPFVVHGEAGISLFPLGPAGSRVTGRAVGAKVLVSRERAEEARVLLESTSRPEEDAPE